MPEFTYTARNQEGQVVANTAEAASREALAQSLRGQGLLPTSIIGKKTKREASVFVMTLLAHVSLLEKLTFAKNLAVTLRAGLPVSRALNVLAKQTPNAYFKKVLGEVAHNVESGQGLSESLAVYPKVFSPIFVNMVKVGEESGQLENTLEYLATQISRDYNLMRRAKGALTYPAVVTVALVIIGYIMFTFILPKLTATFKDFGVELPFLTVTIIKVVDIMSKYSVLVAAGAVAFAAAFWFWHKTPSGRAVLHAASLRLPVIGTVVKKINLARFTIIFSGLLRSGMPIVQALGITADTMGNIYYKQAIHEASDKVKIGVDLVATLERHPRLFTPMVTQMIQVGEESGTMEKVLDEVANFYEAEVDDTVKNLSSIVEPILVMIIGAVVGVLAVGLILPIYNLGQSI